jgi:hypothetical protein
MRSCSDGDISARQTTYVRTDTIYKQTRDTLTKKVNIVSVRYVKDTVFTSIDTCNREYNKMTTYRDTIAIDSIGSVTIVDTVFRNSLKNRTIFKDYRIPLVTKTITITKEQQPKRQLYVGGNLFGDERKLHMITPGLLYKDKKDRVYMANVGVNFDGSVTYGVGAYFKIKIK